MFSGKSRACNSSSASDEQPRLGQQQDPAPGSAVCGPEALSITWAPARKTVSRSHPDLPPSNKTPRGFPRMSVKALVLL